MIVIVDYGMGNVGSIRNMLRKGGVESVISRDPQEIESASKLILPGVGAFDHGMARLHEYGLVELLTAKVRKAKTPFLGICLGMQLLARGSEEGSLAGLGWIDAHVARFRFPPESGLKVPHMGWNTVSTPTQTDQPLSGSRFYFVHSYYVQCHEPSDVLGYTMYGGPFAAAVEIENVMGVQFHPEKSHRYGLAFLMHFARAGVSPLHAVQ